MFTDVCAYEIRRREVDERVGAHAQMGLSRLKLAQAMTRVMTTFLSEVRDSVVSTIVRVHVYELCLTQSLGL